MASTPCLPILDRLQHGRPVKFVHGMLGRACARSAHTRDATSIATEYLAGMEAGVAGIEPVLREFLHSRLLRPAAAADHHEGWTCRLVGKKRTGTRAGRTAWRGRFAPSRGNDDLSFGVSFSLVPESVRHIA
jgi:hypothetical protein